jgi:carbamoyl-phosphate synthase large subunit
VSLVINTPFGREPRTDGHGIRTAAAAARVPCVTTLPGALAALHGIEALRAGILGPLPLQRYHAVLDGGSEQLHLALREPAAPVREALG